jgi:hypothetical protein
MDISTVLFYMNFDFEDAPKIYSMWIHLYSLKLMPIHTIVGSGCVTWSVVAATTWFHSTQITYLVVKLL